MTPITRLVAKKFFSEEEEIVIFPKGHEWIHIVDPKTGKCYDPKEGWIVEGENLEQKFKEVSIIGVNPEKGSEEI